MQCKQIKKCRVCNSNNIKQVLDLGNHVLTGVFPKTKEQSISSGPIRLVKCMDGCGLLQLEHTYSLPEMYGNNYGYRSGLNASMSKHLQDKIRRIVNFLSPANGSVVLDIGSNDGTTLAAYTNKLKRIGIDPTASKFIKYYPEGAVIVPDFFSEKSFLEASGGQLASVITSFSMFYDLEDPLGFMQEVFKSLDSNGVWVFEQSYMPTMIKRNSFDTVCHEHISYYSMKQIKWMMDRVGFKTIDVEFNDINGGSFSVVAAKKDSEFSESLEVNAILETEKLIGLDGLDIYEGFARHAEQNKIALLEFIQKQKSNGKNIGALGASTKGNVLLQYCGLSSNDIVVIGDVNEDKFGAFTPGSLIPIAPEHEVISMELDYLLVLPWHFRKTFVSKQIKGKSRLVFPLPILEVM
jgi:NDP-4-keto-2,6-dideoxyhexose 3-C-methyltransferase